MSKVQTRRSISLNRDAFGALHAYCAKHKIPMSAVVERLVRAELGLPVKGNALPEPEPEDAPPPKRSDLPKRHPGNVTSF